MAVTWPKFLNMAPKGHGQFLLAWHDKLWQFRNGKRYEKCDNEKAVKAVNGYL